MTGKRVFGILAGGALSVLASNVFDADAAGSLVQGSSMGALIVVGLGLVGLGMWGKGVIFPGKPKEKKTTMNEEILKGKQEFKDFFGRFK